MIRIFLYRGYKLRVEDRNGEPWLFVVDICKITGLYEGRAKSYGAILRSIPPSALSAAVDRSARSSGRSYRCVNEAGYHTIITRTRKRLPTTPINDFHDWVISIVLPEIRGASGPFAKPADHNQYVN